MPCNGWLVMILVLSLLKIAAGESFQYGLQNVDKQEDDRETAAVPACDSEIFCFGLLLQAAQYTYLYNDSKSFVDMKLNSDPDVVLAAFNNLSSSSLGNITNEQMLNFIHIYFSPPGSEFEDWIPGDWQETPPFLSNISDPSLRDWARNINELWKVLGRKLIDDVAVNSSLYSAISLQHPVVVPGGRFREIYYWDTYWVMRGLLLSGMHSTAKGILDNFLSLVEIYGFVPNGGRIYFERRSQPPFLLPMFEEYYHAAGDATFLKQSMPILEKEYDFWMSKRVVSVDGYSLNRYASDVNQPRPESYREDKELIHNLTSDEGMSLMKHVTSACESGWDFSTRWAEPEFNANRFVVSQLQTRNVIPVDLNSVLGLCERILAKFHRILGNESTALVYDDSYDRRANAMEKLLWSESDGVYFDYIISKGLQNKNYYASNVNPLWTKSFPRNVNAKQREERMHSYLKASGVLDFPGGIPTSLNASGEQWDFPNAWPPLVHMIIEGLALSESQTLRDEALIQAQKWIHGNHRAFIKTGAMFEKYDVTQSDGVPGAGGEYDVQKGFGWTNGVVMTLLDRYGSVLQANTSEETTGATISPQVPTTSDAPLSRSYFTFFFLDLLCSSIVFLTYL